MKKFLKRKETTLLGKLSNIATAYIAVLICNSLVVLLYGYLFATKQTDQFFVQPVYKHEFLMQFFFMCISAPIWEEALFRFAPIEIIRKTKKSLLFPFIIITSIVFGWLHGSVENIWMQGVFGLIASVLYIKNNYSYLSSVCLHFLWNTSLFFGLYNHLH